MIQLVQAFISSGLSVIDATQPQEIWVAAGRWHTLACLQFNDIGLSPPWPSMGGRGGGVTWSGDSEAIQSVQSGRGGTEAESGRLKAGL